MTSLVGLSALEFGNPYLPQIPEQGIWTPENAWAGLKIGYVGEWIYDRKLEVKRPHAGFYQRVDQFETWSHLAQMAVNLGQRFQFYGQVGTMKAIVDQQPLKGFCFKYETKSQFAGGFGARILLIEWSHFAIGANANGIVSWMDIDQMSQNGEAIQPKNAFIQFKDWQIGGNLGANLDPFIPYIGLCYQSATAKLKDLPKLAAYRFDSDPRKLKARTHVVLFGGIGLTLQRGFDLNLEVRMIGEIGGSMAIDLKF
ncbi:MAG: hypothetical protein H7A39_03435 [Chlamydiales bacterium]|nr:hypothetical protein [Chlamydiales bacterium]